VPSKVVMGMIRRDSELGTLSMAEPPSPLVEELGSAEVRLPTDQPMETSPSGASSVSSLESWLILSPHSRGASGGSERSMTGNLASDRSSFPQPRRSIIANAPPPLPPGSLTLAAKVAPPGPVEPEDMLEPATPYPVRKPYPVRLTDPIVLVRSEPRLANVQFIAPLR